MLPRSTMIRIPPRTAGLMACGMLAACLFGCNWLTPLAFVGEHKKKISAEFDKLPNTRVALLVWTDQATLFDYPFARFELASYLADKLGAEMRQRKLTIDLIDPRDVEDLLQKDPATQIDPLKVGAHFRCDYVLYLEVLEFQIRDAQQPQFLQGRLQTSVAVFDVRAGRVSGERFELTPVQCVYPPGQPILFSAANAPIVRESLYRLFAEHVARKFYEHTVDIS